MRTGKVDIKFLGNSSFLVHNGKVIYIDPFSLSKNEPKADIILITHSHHDHCSISDIEKIAKKGTIIVVPPDAQSKITKIENIDMQIIVPGDEMNLERLKLKAVPAYNINKSFHPKSDEWNGYILKFENIIIYHAGDTDLIPEMQKLTGFGKQGNDFIALLPVGGKFTMDSHEAFKAAKILKPSLAIPMHYGSVAGSLADAENFVKLCKEEGIDAKILEKE